MAKKDKDATLIYKSSEGKKLLKEAGINPKKWSEYKESEMVPGKLVASENPKALQKAEREFAKEMGLKLSDIKLLEKWNLGELEKRVAGTDKFQKLMEKDKDFRAAVFKAVAADEYEEPGSLWGIEPEHMDDDGVEPRMRELVKKYPQASYKDLVDNDELWDYYYEDPKKRKKRLNDYYAGRIPSIAVGSNRDELLQSLSDYLSEYLEYPEVMTDEIKNKIDFVPGMQFGKGRLTKKDIKRLSELAKKLKGIEIDKNQFLQDAHEFKNYEDVAKYIDEHYPEEELKEQLENLAENEPEVAIENKDLIPHTAKEAEQVVDSNPHNDEANNEEIKKDVGSFIKPENGLLGPKEEPPTPKFEDGLLKRDEEQQKEFDRVKEESAREAEEWRQQQFDKFANREPKEAANVSTEPQMGEQPAEDLTFDENAYNAELDRLSGSKKKGGKKRLSDMDVNPLEDLEFNPEEFNKQYAIDHPEQKIQDELSDDEKNDIDYKPSQEELAMLNEANREEWEANGRPRNKDLLDKTVVDPNQQVEDAIESNPVQAEQVAENTLGEGNPIEEEAEQVNDDIPQNDEVNNDAIESASDEDKSEFLNAMDVVDYGLEDQNQYALSDATLDRIKNQLAEDQDKTIVQENNLPDLDIEQIPEEEMRKLFDPLNKEIEARQRKVSEADEALQLAQMHFDENPSEENAKALNKANQDYKDAEFLLQNKQKEYASAFENLGKYYRPKEEEEDEPYFIKEVEDEPSKPLFGRSNGVHFGTTSTPSSYIDSKIDMGNKSRGVGGPRAGIGRIGGFGLGGGSVHPSLANNNTNNPKMESLQSRASKAPIPEKRNENGVITRGGSNNNTPSRNGSMSSGPGMLFRHTNYTSPNKTAPSIPSLGHTSVVNGNGQVPSIGGSSKSNPKLILMAAVESKLNELAQKNPKALEKLQLSHKYKHWAWKGIALDELNPNQLNELNSLIDKIN